MRKLIIFILALLIFSLSGCNSQNKPLNSRSEVTKDGFVYRLISEEDEYNEDQTVKLYAELEYVDDKESVTIYHASSPF